MPIYQYEHVDGEPDDCEAIIEVMQRMADDALTKCPVCDRKVRRIITSVAGHIDNLGNSKLKNAGFTKLVRRDKGVYEKET